MTLSENKKHYFDVCAKEILESCEVQQLSCFVQHGGVSRLHHSMSVARCSYKLSIRLGLKVDYKSLIRGALLHDFFLYDWHNHTDHKWWQMHGFTHPREALNTAMLHFDLNVKEQNIILRHMWPLTVIPPKSKEAFIVSMIDKYCAIHELLNHRKIILLETAGA